MYHFWLVIYKDFNEFQVNLNVVWYMTWYLWHCWYLRRYWCPPCLSHLFSRAFGEKGVFRYAHSNLLDLLFSIACGYKYLVGDWLSAIPFHCPTARRLAPGDPYPTPKMVVWQVYDKCVAMVISFCHYLQMHTNMKFNVENFCVARHYSIAWTLDID